MLPPRPTSLAQMILRDSIRPGDLVIDATAGNGHDTLFLAECVGPGGRVLAFDIQHEAIAEAGIRIRDAGVEARVTFHQSSHALMAEFASAGSAAAVMFNLGYLPGEDHGMTTLTSETLTAMEAAARVIKPGGMLSVVCYPGHPEGANEAGAVETWMTALPSQGWRVAKYCMLGTKRPAPFLMLGAKP